MSKVYKGYELIKAIADGEIKEKEIKLRFGSGYYTFYVDEDKIINNTNGTGLYICKCLNEEFEILNCEDEVDIDNIEEVNHYDVISAVEGKTEENINEELKSFSLAFNKLLKWAKQKEEEIKELKSLNIEISEKDINEAVVKAIEERSKEIKGIRGEVKCLNL